VEYSVTYSPEETNTPGSFPALRIITNGMPVRLVFVRKKKEYARDVWSA